jgi:hypothetical protein
MKPDGLAQETSRPLSRVEIGSTATKESWTGRADLRHGVQGGVYIFPSTSDIADGQVHASMSLSSSHSKVWTIITFYG